MALTANQMVMDTHVFELPKQIRKHEPPLLAESGRQSGIALILVLWMLALLTLIAGSMVFSSRTAVQVAANLQSQASVEALADAGAHKAIHELARPLTDPLRWRGDGLTHLWTFQGSELRVTILDESAKVDLNAAPVILLKGLFRALNVAEPDADALADAVADWRDADDLRSLHGAEKADYAAAGRDYGPANAPFENIDELRQVLGMNDALFRRLERLVTVHSRRPGINSAVAPREVLLALPRASPEQVDVFLQQRQILIQQGLPVPAFPSVQGLAAGATESVFTIQVEAVLGDNARFYREAVVRLTGDVRDPVVVLAWRAPPAGQGVTAPGDVD